MHAQIHQCPVHAPLWFVLLRPGPAAPLQVETRPEPQVASAPLSARLHALVNCRLLSLQPRLQDPSSET